MKSLLAALAGLILPSAFAAEPMPVVASFSVLGDLVRQVGGDRVAVKTLVGADADAHVFQPAPTHLKTVAGAKVMVVNGLGFEGWMERLIKASRFGGLVVVASQGITPLKSESSHDHAGHAGHEFDPHAWQDLSVTRRYVVNIADGLSKADPANGAYYQQRASAYDQKLQELEQWATQEIAKVPASRRKIITSHDAFAYLGRRFGIQFLAAQGMSTESDASAGSVARLIRQIRQEKVKTVFVENISNPKLIEQISRETGASVGSRLYSDALSSPSESAPNYLAMWRYNFSTLLSAMKAAPN
ncbi:metal ABC transporter substrate-binding protein [Parachitinimonas caeni]|uniref:Metal ABC transporter substrate-binding protein n=1 Tax=Parachitinimonas caeni TaxID=3031301 RepID=A0ABT7DUJ6_9NEIS|nr:metal ABC transporter substrate-binding protein [Parachitinimonas caeni]MDK2123644.1 metal ABC transporter substrate-binding protein [Parachitinimonas caeni]